MMDERLRGFSVPFGISARWAAIVGSALATGMYALWLWALLRALACTCAPPKRCSHAAHSFVRAVVSLDQISSSVELQALRTFLKTSASLALINGLAAHSATLLALSVQHADALRHLSRFVWLLWLFDWMAAWTGILGFIFDSSLRCVLALGGARDRADGSRTALPATGGDGSRSSSSR